MVAERGRGQPDAGRARELESGTTLSPSVPSLGKSAMSVRKGWRTCMVVGARLLLVIGVALVIGKLYPLLFSDSWRMHPRLDIPGVQRLNKDLGVYHDPAWSPDSRYLAYVRADAAPPPRERSSDYEIHVLDLQTGIVQRLTDNDRDDRNPCWSPEGTQIAFHSVEIFSDWDWPPRDYIWIMNADGTNLKRVSPPHLSFSSPVWAPDGQNLLVVEEPGRLRYLLHLATGELRPIVPLSSGAHAAWSPDSCCLAYTKNRDGRSA